MSENKPRNVDAVDVCECKSSFNLLLFLLVIAVASVLCFYGLGRRTLWQDEGETAVLAQRVLDIGIPKAFDGNNLIYQGPAGLYEYDKEYRWIFHPWGQFYLTAAAFKLFGQTNFAARFPFALCGVLTVALLYMFVWRHWHSTAAAALSALLLATSTVFVLHCRQCRYYSLSTLTCLAVVAVFVELMKRPRRLWQIMFAVVLASQFYVDFGTLIVILPGLAASLWPMGARRRELAAAAKGFAGAVLLMMPGLVFHWARITAAGGNHSFLRMLLIHTYYFDNWFVPLVFLLPAGAMFLRRLFKSGWQPGDKERIILACVFVTASDVIGMAWAPPFPFIRFLLPSLSLAKLLLALILIKAYILLREKGLPLLPAGTVIAVIFLALVFSNVFSLATQYLADENRDNYKILDFCTKSKPAVRTEFAGLIYEMTHDFVCPDSVAVNVVDDLARAGESVVIDYSGLVLMFYRPDLRVYYVYTLANLRQPPELLVFCHNPWHINFEEELKKYNYIHRTIMVPAASWAGNIPEPGQHWFATPANRVPFEIYLREDLGDRLLKLPQTTEQLQARWCRPR